MAVLVVVVSPDTESRKIHAWKSSCQRLRQSLGLLSRSDLGSNKDKPGLKEGRGQPTHAPIPPEEVPAGVVAFVVAVVVVSPGTIYKHQT